MEKITSKHIVKKIKNGLPHFGEVYLIIELTQNNTLDIIENYSGSGFCSQGYLETVPEKGYDHWKKGVANGVKYAFSKLVNNNGLKITILEVSGLSTDTNPTILGYACSRAVLNKLINNESEAAHNEIEKLMFISWNYEYNSIPDFEKMIINGAINTPSRYRNQ